MKHEIEVMHLINIMQYGHTIAVHVFNVQSFTNNAQLDTCTTLIPCCTIVRSKVISIPTKEYAKQIQ